jgi:hypothetical protein
MTEEEFAAMLQAEEETPPTATPIFVAPKVTNRGFYGRQERAEAFSRQQTMAVMEMARLEREFNQAGAAPSAELLDQMQAALGRNKELREQQVEFLLGFVRGIKYHPPTHAGGGEATPARVKVRPGAGPALDAFEEEARALLKECSQAEFQAMLQAAQGVGAAPVVPPANGGRSETPSPATG